MHGGLFAAVFYSFGYRGRRGQDAISDGQDEAQEDQDAISDGLDEAQNGQDEAHDAQDEARDGQEEARVVFKNERFAP